MERISVSCYLRKNTLRLLASYWKPPRHPTNHSVSFTCLTNMNYFSVGTFKRRSARSTPISHGMLLPCSSPCASCARENFSSTAQVDLIDMQSMCQGQHKWIMVYPDHLTKFCVLRPLTSKRASEVAYQLLDIYLLLGAPSILQSDNGSEFTAQVITEADVA